MVRAACKGDEAPAKMAQGLTKQRQRGARAMCGRGVARRGVWGVLFPGGLSAKTCVALLVFVFTGAEPQARFFVSYWRAGGVLSPLFPIFPRAK